MVLIKTTLGKLWDSYAGKQQSGRVECPVTVQHRGDATHIYNGFGCIRLEKISKLVKGKKGFQGEAVVKGRRDTEFYIQD